MMRSQILPLLALLLPVLRASAAPAPPPVPARAAPAAVQGLRIVAAENFYGDIAAQLAGPDAHVVSILRNAAADPHLFEPDISAARAVADAELVVYNGLSYDTWMEQLLAATRSDRRRIVVAASVAPAAPNGPIARRRRGSPDSRAASRRDAAQRNPHLWYDPSVVQSVARAISAQLVELDPARAALYAARLRRFLESISAIDAEIAGLHGRYAGVAVTATEPLAQYLTDAIGLTMLNRSFQLAAMNGTEPSARETEEFERSLRGHQARVLIYNSQVESSAVERLLRIARSVRVPIVGMTETEPPGTDYQQWMLTELRALGSALKESRP